MTDIERTAAYCETLIDRHTYDQTLDACTDCGHEYPCWVRLTAESVTEDLKRLAAVDSQTTSVAVGSRNDKERI